MISIHAPRRGSDLPMFPDQTVGNDFNPRSPQGERLKKMGIDAEFTKISIHAPRRGSDRVFKWLSSRPYDFNPRSPQGERLKKN